MCPRQAYKVLPAKWAQVPFMFMSENHYLIIAKSNIFVIGINWVISAVRVTQNKRFHTLVCLLVQYFLFQEISMQRECLEKKENEQTAGCDCGKAFPDQKLVKF